MGGVPIGGMGSDRLGVGTPGIDRSYPGIDGGLGMAGSAGTEGTGGVPIGGMGNANTSEGMPGSCASTDSPGMVGNTGTDGTGGVPIGGMGNDRSSGGKAQLLME